MRIKEIGWPLLLCATVMWASACSRAPTASITLRWAPPTENEDGTELVDLAGYRVYWGRDPGGPYEHRVEIEDADKTSHVVEKLPDGTWYFVMTALNQDQAESTLSNEVSIRIEDGEPVTEATHTSSLTP